MSETMTARMQAFLWALSQHDGPIAPHRLAIESSPKQDIARQKCRKLGLAVRVIGSTGRKQWQITPAGRAAAPPRSPT